MTKFSAFACLLLIASVTVNIHTCPTQVPKFEGDLRLTVGKGKFSKSVADADWGGKADFYVSATVGKTSGKTPVVHSAENCPKFDSEIKLVAGPHDKELVVALMDQDITNPDDFLGSVKIPLTEVSTENQIKKDYELKDKKGNCIGTLKLSLPGPAVKKEKKVVDDKCEAPKC